MTQGGWERREREKEDWSEDHFELVAEWTAHVCAKREQTPVPVSMKLNQVEPGPLHILI